MTDEYLSGIEFTSNGFLLLRQTSSANGNDVIDDEMEIAQTVNINKISQEYNNTGRQPLVLESAAKLWLKFHPHCQEIQFDSSRTTRGTEPVPSQTSAASAHGMDLTTPQQSMVVTGGAHEPSSSSSAKMAFPNLVRFRDMSNNIMPIMEDIDKMKDQQRFLTKKEREERQQRIEQALHLQTRKRIEALQRQQNAHNEKKSKQSFTKLTRGAGAGADGIEDDRPVDMDPRLAQEVDKEKDRKQQREHGNKYVHATERVVKTLNSIRLLAPILVKILNHTLRDDTSLIIGKDTILESNRRKSGQKRQCWMLGEYVYDTGSGKNMQSIQNILRHLLRPILASSDELDHVMDDKVDWNLVLVRWYTRLQSPAPKHLMELNEKQMVLAKIQDTALHRHFQEEASDGDQQDAFTSAVNKLRLQLNAVLKDRFRGCRLEVYGSCLSNLSIGKSSDVDISIHIPELHDVKKGFERGTLKPKAYDDALKRHVYAVAGRLKQRHDVFFDIEAVARARVPVVKGAFRFAENPYTHDGSLHFDICFFNDIAVRNSTLLRDYTNVCPQSKNLMMAVKKWAKVNKICSSANQTLSSYAWMILVIFYLQQLGMLPNLQCSKLMRKADYEPRADPCHEIDALDTAFVPWERVKGVKAWELSSQLVNIPVSVLFHGFFHFLSSQFAPRLLAVSIRTSTIIPKPISPKCSLSFLCIEDPFETFDSHRPHELSSPASPHAQVEIMALLAETECHSRNVLLRGDGDIWTLPNRADIDNRHTEQKPPINERFGKMMANLMTEASKKLDERIVPVEQRQWS